jgi:benzaldehyde dehydrogenase (NAD)
MVAQATRRSDGKLFVAGEHVDAAGAETAPVHEKATGEAIGRYAVGGPADVDRAVAAAKAAFPGWAGAPAAERAALLRRCAALLDERAAEFEDVLMRETGGVRSKARGEVGAARGRFQQGAALAVESPGDLLHGHRPGKLAMLQRIPVGVVGAIIPWNFPLVLAMRAIAPSLALGNTLVLKPASLTPIGGGQLLVELFQDAGAPPGVINLVTGSGSAVGMPLAAHPDVDLVHFTGSTEVGRDVAEIAGRQLKRTVLELGGDNALVVLEDADVERAASCGAWAAFEFQGQTCISASRHIVHRSIADRYVKALAERARRLRVGDPVRQEVDLGPLISEGQRDRVHQEIVQPSIAQGARVVEGATYDGLYYRPTVLADVTRDMPAFREEIFGPVAPVTVVDSDEEALELVNAERSLVSAVHTSDALRGLAFAERVQCGLVHVNDAMGRPTGETDHEELTTTRYIGLQREPVTYPFG